MNLGDTGSVALTRFAIHIDFCITSLDYPFRGDVEERIVQMSNLVPRDIPEVPLFAMRS
jgi:hypothetical protein